MEMIEVKTAELVGPALDWAVAKAIGGDRKPHRFASNDDAPMYEAWVFPEGSYCRACTQWSPSTDWSQGGPLIEKYSISFNRFCTGGANSDGSLKDALFACIGFRRTVSGKNAEGRAEPTQYLIVACRAIVAAKLGDTVRVPAALVGGEE